MRDTSSCYDDQLYQTISKFHHYQQQSYGPKRMRDGRTDNAATICIINTKLLLYQLISVLMTLLQTIILLTIQLTGMALCNRWLVLRLILMFFRQAQGIKQITVVSI